MVRILKRGTAKPQLINLHPKELALILALREKFPYGEVIIVTRDGIPQRIKQAWIFDDLQLSPESDNTNLQREEI